MATFQTGKNQADAKRSAEILGKIEDGSAFAIDAAGYRVAEQSQSKTIAHPIAYVTPKFYIPRLASYPLWFVVQTALKDDKDAKATYLVFQKASVASEGWKLVMAPTAGVGVTLPTPTTDRRGNAISIPAKARLALPPQQVPSAHAALLSRDMKSGAAKRVGSDRFTNDIQNENAKEAAALKATAKITYEYRPATDPRFLALQTCDGGALVFYLLENTYTYVTYPLMLLRPKPHVAALGAGPELVQRAVTTHLDQFAAYVPRSGKVTVLAHDGALTAAVLTGPPD